MQNTEHSDEPLNNLVRLSSIASQFRLQGSEINQEQLVYQILNVPDSRRGKKIRDALEQWLDYLEYFGRLKQLHGEAYVRKIYANLTADRYKQGSVVIKTGDQSHFFYMILSGSVMVLYPRAKTQIEEDVKSLTEDILKLDFRERVFLNAKSRKHYKEVPPENISDLERYYNDAGVPVMTVQNVLGKGQSFGQLGILYKTKRLSDIVCLTDCLIAKISRDKYLKIVGEESQKKLIRRQDFLATFFSSHIGKMMRSDAQRYLYLFEEIDYKVNTILFDIDAPVRGLYIIVDGSVVLKTREISPNDSHGIGKYKIFKQNRKRKLVVLKQIGIGRCFGIEGIVKNNWNTNEVYTYQASTSSSCKILFCGLTKLLQVLKYDKALQKQLKDKFQVQQECIQIHEIPSPEAVLKSYESKRMVSTPTYRLSPNLLDKHKTIRSTKKSMSQHRQSTSQINSGVLGYKSWAIASKRFLVDKRKQPQLDRIGIMSRSTQAKAMENLASSLESKIIRQKQLKAKRSLLQANKFMANELERKNIECRIKHLRRL